MIPTGIFGPAENQLTPIDVIAKFHGFHVRRAAILPTRLFARSNIVEIAQKETAAPLKRSLLDEYFNVCRAFRPRRKIGPITDTKDETLLRSGARIKRKRYITFCPM